MKQTNVLVSVPLEEKHLAAIRAVSPQVNLMYNPEKEALRSIITQAEVLLAFRPPPDLAPPPRLRWMQLWSAGIDDVLDTRLVQEVPLLTTASSVHPIQVAEYAFCCMLMLAHRFPLMLRAQFQRRPLVRRRELTPTELRDKTLAIVGLGNIGREIARLGQAFGMRVLASRRS